jgi:hypothetical protein
MPNAKTRLGSWVQVYSWLHIALGWLFSSIFVVGITGIVKQD